MYERELNADNSPLTAELESTIENSKDILNYYTHKTVIECSRPNGCNAGCLDTSEPERRNALEQIVENVHV